MCTITTASLRTFPSPRRRLWAAGLPPAPAATSLRAVGADLCSARHVKGGRVCGLCKRCLSLSMTVQAVACTVLHLCRVSHGQAPRNPPQGVLSCFQWSRDQNGPQDNQGAGPHSHRARHTAHVTPRRSRDQNGPQDNPGAGPCSHRAGHVTRMGLRITRGLARAHTVLVTPRTSHRAGHVTRMGLRTIRGLARAHTAQGREPALGSPSSVVEPLLQSWAVWDFAVLLETCAEEGLRCPLLPSGAVSGDRGP